MTAARHQIENVSRPQPPAQPGSTALDQWRGLALVLVLVAHAFHESTRVDGLGRVGVNLFFFISGILVFRSLARGRQATRQGVAVAFWRRRLRRLYPALLAYLSVMLAGEYWLQRLPGQPPNSDYGTFLKHVPAALLYLVNYTPAAPRSLGHLWSLACEMQFYLLSPLIFFLGGRTDGRRNLVYGGLLLILAGLGASEPLLLANPYAGPKYHFEFAVWPMLLGFWCEFQRDRILRIPARWLKIAFWSFLLPGLACGLLMLRGPQMKTATVAAGALILVPCLLGYLAGWPAGSLAGKWLRWLGERTYSIYLWQQPFTICFFLPVRWWPAGAVVSALWGGLWFHWFERPFLSESRKLPIPQTPVPATPQPPE
jgi:peptidoglycan/LPS O-acetylase OafA/YrhL